MEKQLCPDMNYCGVPLPDDVAAMKHAGFFDDCRAAIANYLSGDIPDCLRKRLELELTRLDFLPLSEYPYTDEEALSLLRETFRDFKDEELPQLVNSRAADWLYIKGVRHFHRRFIANILTTRDDYAARQLHPAAEDEASAARKGRIKSNIALMKEKGGRAARITVKQTFSLKPEAVENAPLTVHLPIPKPCTHQSDIRILELSHPDLAVVAPEEAPMRTVCFHGAKAGDTFSVTYSYVNRLAYVEPVSGQSGDTPLPDDALACLGEQTPNILFTPFMRQLSQEIQGTETDPLKKARNAYDFVTTKVKYSYMREYAALDTICDYAAKNLKGDCGVQAILFITLCRLAGVPARWQSGFAADPASVGCHDWAQLYVNQYGWLYADPSYGGSAYRAGDLERWNYYFGNLDIFRTVFNSDLHQEFQPPKAHFRADPTDNQRGEAEYPHRGILPFEFQHNEDMLAFEEL